MERQMRNYLQVTPLLDFNHPSLQELLYSRGWLAKAPIDRVKSIYNYVRDEILFGYNQADNIPASLVLADGFGQCNTKSTLLMALLRAAHIPNRIHGFTIDKALQKGAITGIWYRLSPKRILHSWVEVLVAGEWYYLEGVILDKPYLKALQNRFTDCKTTFCGYGAYTNSFQAPAIEWNLNHTYIQVEGIEDDFGLFDDPDAFYRDHGQALGWMKRFFFQHWVRRLMNRNVRRIRCHQPQV